MSPKLFILSCLGSILSACAAIPTAPQSMSRTELEVDVAVDSAIEILRSPDDKESIERIVSDAVLSLADVGMRFYPVSSASYDESDVRPEFLLTVEIVSLRAQLDQQVVYSSREHGIDTAVDELACTVVATLVRRRADGPSLIVGRAFGRGDSAVREASASVSSVAEFELAVGSEGNAPTFSASQLSEAVHKASIEALSGILKPIDRELKMQRASDEPVGK